MGKTTTLLLRTRLNLIITTLSEKSWAFKRNNDLVYMKFKKQAKPWYQKSE